MLALKTPSTRKVKLPLLAPGAEEARQPTSIRCGASLKSMKLLRIGAPLSSNVARKSMYWLLKFASSRVKISNPEPVKPQKM